MPDTMRTLSALQAIINDNSSGDISAQDVRDFLVSAYQPQGVCGHRLTTESGVPVSTSDRTSQSTVYLTPYLHNRIGLYDGTSWIQLAVPEIAVALSGLTSGKNYDVFCAWSTPTHSSTNTGTDIVTWSANPGWVTGTYVIVTSTGGGLTAGTAYWYNRASSTTGSFHTTLANALAGTSKVDLSANVTQTLVGVFIDLGPTWDTGSGSDTARGTGAGSTALTTQDGVNVNSVSVTGSIGAGTIAAKAGLYVGTLRTTSTTATEDSAANRLLWNAYNAVPRTLLKTPNAGGTWDVSSSSNWSEMYSSGAATLKVVCGLLGPSLTSLTVAAFAIRSGTAAYPNVGVAKNSTTTAVTSQGGIRYSGGDASSGMVAQGGPHNRYQEPTPLGYTYYVGLNSAENGLVTFYGVETGSSTQGRFGTTIQGVTYG